jgi:small subunit ribosomal protein S9
MAELNSLAELGTAAAVAQPAAPVHVQKLDKSGRAYATATTRNSRLISRVRCCR